ncbi:MAG: hypothetical protein DESF_01989 [Desulfovibrio sp.]
MNKKSFFRQLLHVAIVVFNLTALLRKEVGAPLVNIVASIDLCIQSTSGPEMGSLLDLWCTWLQVILMALLP